MFVPATKSPQALISEEVGSGVGATQVDNSVQIKGIKYISWRLNLTALSNETDGTVILFEPSVSAIDLPEMHFQ